MSLFTQSGVSLSHIDKLSLATISATFEAAQQLLDSEQDWKQGRTYTQDGGHRVHTFKRGPQSASERLNWHMRDSEHGTMAEGELAYDEFRSGLLLNHTTNEQEYIPDLKHASKIKSLREAEFPRAEVWLIQYKTPIGTANREFASLVLTKDLDPIKPAASTSSTANGATATPPGDRRRFIVVQVPVLDVPVSKGYARGKYTSVECVEEVVGGDGQLKVRWRMATASSAGGALPQLATDLALPSQIAHDVPNFINWALKKRKGKA